MELVGSWCHELPLNVGFADGPVWQLLCAYDVRALDDAILLERPMLVAAS